MIGIYKITNKLNNKSYIGKSIDVEKRLKSHKSAVFSNCGREASAQGLLREEPQEYIGPFCFQMLSHFHILGTKGNQHHYYHFINGSAKVRQCIRKG